MTLQHRDKRALALLGAASAISAIVYFWPAGGAGVVAPAVNSVPAAERRVQRLRELIATLPGKQKVVDSLTAQLKQREKAVIEAETAAQAQAQLLQIVRKLTQAQAPPMEIASNELGGVVALGNNYGETYVSVNTTCRIEQLINLLADITVQPELIATHELRIQAADARQKTVTVRLTVSGVLPRRMVPERKALGAL
jgi:hypothetical protein